MIKAKQPLRAPRDWSRSLRDSVENPHPRRRERVTENYHDRVSFPKGGPLVRVPPLGSQPPPATALRIRGAQGDSSRYSLLMGVLFSSALGSPGTCHASLNFPHLPSHNARYWQRRTSKISRKSGNRTRVRFDFRSIPVYIRARGRVWVFHAVTLRQEGEKDAPIRVPLDQRQSAVKQWRGVQRGFYCIAERAKLKAQCAAPFVLRGSAPSSYPRTLGFARICSFLRASFFFFF